MFNVLFVYPFLLSLFLTIFFTPFVIKIAKKFKLVDDPKKHKHPAITHKKIIPRAGGLGILLGIVISALFFLPHTYQLFIILFSCFLVVLVGLLDDRYDLSPYLRFVSNILAALFVVLLGVNIPYVTNPLGGILHFGSFQQYFLPQLFAVIWIVWVMNMLNWSKGVDGQMPGIAAISAIIIGIASLRFPMIEQNNVISAQLSFITAGAAIGFLFFNFFPAKIFPGYSATILGFLIGVLSILSGVKLATAILVMGIPTADALFTVIRRVLSKRSPFWHDKGHLHHLLLSFGFGQRSIAIFYWIMSLVLGIISLNLSSKGKLFAILLVLVLVGGIILGLKFLTREEKI